VDGSDKGNAVKHKVCELEGALLDAAVAKAEGWRQEGAAWVRGNDASGMVITQASQLFPFPWSSDWKWGGPIMERERISVFPTWGLGWGAFKADSYTASGDKCVSGLDGFTVMFDGVRQPAHGNVPLVAAMRTYVASRFGEEVELP
jgi:Protein of unknown function (DUF2591)